MPFRKTIAAFLALGIASCAHLLTGPDATVKQHMQEVTVPASDAVFAVAGETPKDDAGWKNVKTSALALADSGQWLLDNAPTADPQIWRKTAKDLADAAKAAALAAEIKDSDNVSAAGNTLYEACESCHASYLKKPTT